MDPLLYALGALALAAGLAGLFLPALPGGVLMFAGALLLAWADHFTRVGWPTLAAAGVLALLMTVVDHVAGVLGAKAFGASRRAVLGAAVGLVVGLFFGLPGILLGPLAGAVLVEYLQNPEVGRAARAGLGVLVGMLAGGAVKIALAFVFLGVLAAGFFL